MSNNMDNDRSITTNKMYPIDLAPQKITIVKSVSNAEVKMAHLIPGQPKTTGTGQLITHTGPVGLMRPTTHLITTGGVGSSQPQMIVSGSPILQGAQIVSQGSQIIGQGSQIISQSIIGSSQILSPGTQIISQGTQLTAVSSSNSANNTVSITSTVGGTQMLNVSGQLVGGTGNLVVSPSVRTLPPSVRVLPPLPHHNTRPVLSGVSVSTASGVLVSKAVTSHVPRGLAAGASLAVRPVAPASVTQPVGSQGSPWSNARGPRSALVYGTRSTLPRTPTAQTRALTASPVTPLPISSVPTTSNQPLHVQTVSTSQTHSAIVTLPSPSVLTSSGVITGTVRGPAPRATTPTPTIPTGPRPLPLLQRNYQSTKVVGVASVGVRGVVGNSAPTQLYYEVPRAAQPHVAALAPPRPLTSYAHAQVSVVNAVPVVAESRPPVTTIANTPVLPRPSILRKRDIDGSPTKTAGIGPPYREVLTGWEDVPSGGMGEGSARGSGGSTTMSASSSPAPDDEQDPPRLEPDLSPRKKPRKQLLTSEVRQCEFPTEEAPPTPPPAAVNPPPKGPLLSSTYICGWRSTALHFQRPSDVRRKEPRARDILAIANQKHVLTSAEGWKVHHLTAQMDDLVSLEGDVGEQLAGVLRSLESASGRASAALQPHSHTLLELIKGNIQRSKIVCEGIQESREDILRVFTHRNFVSDILSRQADKRCFRKHRSQS